MIWWTIGKARCPKPIITLSHLNNDENFAPGQGGKAVVAPGLVNIEAEDRHDKTYAMGVKLIRS